MRETKRVATEFETVPRAAKRLGIGLGSFRKAVKKGEIPTHNLGGWPRVYWPDVLKWARSKRTSPPTAHAEERVREVLEREARAGDSP
jgi:excisionase family DNA binding protein